MPDPSQASLMLPLPLMRVPAAMSWCVMPGVARAWPDSHIETITTGVAVAKSGCIRDVANRLVAA